MAARTLHALFLLARTEALSNAVGHLKKNSNDWLQPHPQTPKPTVSRPFRPHRVVNLATQGIGLRPQPWAPFSRPVGPDGPATRVMLCRRKSAGEQAPAFRSGLSIDRIHRSNRR